jgi:hypothetical protein
MSKQPQTNDTLIEISSKLDKVLKLLALQTVKGLEKESEKIELLDTAGFSSSDIGKALNKSTANVCTVLKAIKEKAEKPEKTGEKAAKKGPNEAETKVLESKQS